MKSQNLKLVLFLLGHVEGTKGWLWNRHPMEWP